MLFNSLQFAGFFIIFYLLYFHFRLKHKLQNIMLLLASCIFYAAWDWRFLFLVFTTVVTDYFCGAKIYLSTEERARKRYLLLSILVNLSILGFFKYYNFFTRNLEVLLNQFGIVIHSRFINMVLPVGISFYIFKSLSYTIDIYRKEMQPARSFLDYALFILYFPQLLAGPISRAKDFLPQISRARELSLDKFYEGCYLIFWGVFLKVFVADNLAAIVDPIFSSPRPYNGVMVLISIYAFAFQIYCDFAGYSHIANGLSRCMGFETMLNFNLPYFSTNPREFWHRWHISLSTWLRDYLYIPMGGNRKTALQTYRNLLLTMLLGGLWHGAAWTFVIWGLYHGFLLIGQRAFGPLSARISIFRSAISDKVWFWLKVIFFFHLVCLGWLIFRAGSFAQVCAMLRALSLNFNFRDPDLGLLGTKLFFYISISFFLQLPQFYKNDTLFILKTKVWTKAIFYFVCFYLLIIFGAGGDKEFIYFQF